MSKFVKIIAEKRRNIIRNNLYNSIQRTMLTEKGKFLSVRDVCRILNVDLSTVCLQANTNPNELLTGICAWDSSRQPVCCSTAICKPFSEAGYVERRKGAAD